jgi:RNA polymerase sigma factor (sigma-70 family)
MSQEEQVRRQIVELLPRLRRFARTITRNVHDADDLVQLAIERALLKHDQWRPELKFDGWMFGIMCNALSLNSLRNSVWQSRWCSSKASHTRRPLTCSKCRSAR